VWTFPNPRRGGQLAGDLRRRVVVGSDDGRLYCVNLADGKERWAYEIGAPVTASPAAADGPRHRRRGGWESLRLPNETSSPLKPRQHPQNHELTTSSKSSNTKKQHDETEVGNYFVANYPPFSYWDAETAKTVRGLLDQPQKPGVPLGVYFHVPFCRKRCHFCYFRVYTDKNADDVKGYLDAGIAELEIYAKSPLIRGRKPKFVYFGGGTPSYLSVSQLESLTDRMKALLPWDEVEEVTFEAEPGHAHGSRSSPRCARSASRAFARRREFRRAYPRDQRPRASHQRDLSRLQFRPLDRLPADQHRSHLRHGRGDRGQLARERAQDHRIAARQRDHLPNGGAVQHGHLREMKAEGKLTAPVANWHTKRGWVDYAFSELEKAGYTVTSGYTAVRDPKKPSSSIATSFGVARILSPRGGFLLARRRHALPKSSPSSANTSKPWSGATCRSRAR
jgi:hypothetical protein